MLFVSIIIQIKFAVFIPICLIRSQPDFLKINPLLLMAKKLHSEVLIRCFVVDNEATLGEEEAIGLCLEGRVNHLLLLLLTEFGQLVHILPLVCGFGNAEGEVEFELRQDLSAEEMLFNQS